MSEERMPLCHALRVLADIHTRDDDQFGCTVVVGASPMYSQWSIGDYLAAWRAVREAVGMPSEPLPPPPAGG